MNDMNKNKHLPVFEGNLFTWKKRVGTSEVSSLVTGAQCLFTRVWKDYMGFIVRSHRTGEEKVFFLTCEHRNLEGELMTWEFASSDDIRISIFND